MRRCRPENFSSSARDIRDNKSSFVSCRTIPGLFSHGGGPKFSRNVSRDTIRSRETFKRRIAVRGVLVVVVIVVAAKHRSRGNLVDVFPGTSFRRWGEGGLADFRGRDRAAVSPRSRGIHFRPYSARIHEADGDRPSRREGRGGAGESANRVTTTAEAGIFTITN